MGDATPILDANGVADAVDRLAADVLQQVDADQPLNVVGIRTRGETLAARLREKLAGQIDVRPGVLDITLYRDDLQEIGPAAVVRTTQLPTEITGVTMLLVDDVIYTGRSIKAALNVVADHGRPSRILLAVLADRGGRELPIQPDFVALPQANVPEGGRLNVRLTEDDGRDAVEVSR